MESAAAAITLRNGAGAGLMGNRCSLKRSTTAIVGACRTGLLKHSQACISDKLKEVIKHGTLQNTCCSGLKEVFNQRYR